MDGGERRIGVRGEEVEDVHRRGLRERQSDEGRVEEDFGGRSVEGIAGIEGINRLN